MNGCLETGMSSAGIEHGVAHRSGRFRRVPGLVMILVAAALSGCNLGASSAETSLAGDTITLSPAAPDSDRDQVIATLEQYYSDFSALDWARYRDHFWSGATLTTVWQAPNDSLPRVSVTTVDRFIELAPQGPGSREIFEERMSGADVRADGALAQVWATYEARFGDPGDISEWTGTDAFTLMRHNGRWRIASLAYASGN
jgi:hypothetical protein